MLDGWPVHWRNTCANYSMMVKKIRQKELCSRVVCVIMLEKNNRWEINYTSAPIQVYEYNSSSSAILNRIKKRENKMKMKILKNGTACIGWNSTARHVMAQFNIIQIHTNSIVRKHYIRQEYIFYSWNYAM